MPVCLSTTSLPSTSSTQGGGVFEIEITEDRPGFLAFMASGNGAWEAFKNEGGGHRWQRVPPTERRGRVHTSTVTVAVLGVPTDEASPIKEADLEWSASRGSGPGGQHRNTTASCIRLVHRPTGIAVHYGSERSQHQNRRVALSILRARLQQKADEAAWVSRNDQRKEQVGSGQRGDKIRTIALQRDQVTDHRTGKKISAKRYLEGMVDLVC